MKSFSPFIRILVVMLIIGCNSTSKKSDNKKFEIAEPSAQGYSIIFHYLDDFAHLYVDDSLVFKTDDYYVRDEGELVVDMDSFLTEDSKKIRVELINMEGINPWSISCELFLDGIAVDSYSANSNGGEATAGLADSYEFILE